MQKSTIKLQKDLCLENGGIKHILTEGDCQIALKKLSKNFKNKISVIYIDPPYRTGNSSLPYFDCHTDIEWIELITNTLSAGKELLSENGTIFISIDDNKIRELIPICDEIFGKDNFISMIIWETKASRTNIVKTINIVHEYILIYKKGEKCILHAIDLPKETASKYKNPDNDINGPWITKPLWADSNTNKEKVLLLPDGTQLSKKWFVSQSTLNELFANNKIHRTKDGIYAKVYLNDTSKKGFVVDTFWSPKFFKNDLIHYCGSSNDGTKEIKELFGRNIFHHPKPTALLKKIIRIASGPNDIVLDFFAGSGSTGHAVLLLNQEDGSKRRFVLCTNNENDICRKICYERLKKVIFGYGKHEGTGGSLDYYKIT